MASMAKQRKSPEWRSIKVRADVYERLCAKLPASGSDTTRLVTNTFCDIKSHPGCGATRLTVQERAALRAYIGQLGYRGAVRELGVARGTLTTAVLGGAMRNSTAFLLRARVLAAQSTPPEPQPTSDTPP